MISIILLFIQKVSITVHPLKCMPLWHKEKNCLPFFLRQRGKESNNFQGFFPPHQRESLLSVGNFFFFLHLLPALCALNRKKGKMKCRHTNGIKIFSSSFFLFPFFSCRHFVSHCISAECLSLCLWGGFSFQMYLFLHHRGPKMFSMCLGSAVGGGMNEAAAA